MSSPSLYQTAYGPPPPAYGPPNFIYPSLTSIFSLITTPVVVVSSFVIGIILYLITHKKIFLIIPLILSILYFIR